MINEELDWSQTNVFMERQVTAVIVGPVIDDRSAFFYSFWRNTACLLVELEALRDFNTVTVRTSRQGALLAEQQITLIPGLLDFLRTNAGQLGAVCMDVSSLQHSVLMYLTQLLLTEVKPKQLFATYAQPEEYMGKQDSEDFRLSEERLGLRAVPGFTRRSRKEPIKLLAFLGFEGDRLTKIMEDMSDVERVIPIVGFPSFRPGWQARTLRNCQRGIEFAGASNDVQKCRADSVFGAYDLVCKMGIRRQATPQLSLALAPLGTRPHSLACAIFATKNPETRIVYDHPVEMEKRSRGIALCRTYHLSSFL